MCLGHQTSSKDQGLRKTRRLASRDRMERIPFSMSQGIKEDANGYR
jgi:hypothetical protein